MQFSIFVTFAVVLITCPLSVAGFTPPAYCVTVTSEIPKGSVCPDAPSNCATQSCLEHETVTQSCICPEIYTAFRCQTACPTGGDCSATSYSTVTEPCTTPPPYIPPTTIYTNATKTKTKTEIITITTCPKSVHCTGQTVTFTSTEVCPTSTCTCVLPGGPQPDVTYTTTTLPITTPPPDETTTTKQNTLPVPTPSSSPSPTFIEANVARKWAAKAGGAVCLGLLIAVLGML